MRRVIRYQTHDGEVHLTEKDARHRLDVQYGEIISQLARMLARESEWSYYNLQNSIDKNLDVFLKLKQIKDDMAVENPLEEGLDD